MGVAIEDILKATRRNQAWVLKKYFDKNIVPAASVPCQVFLSLTSLSGHLQNRSYRRAEEPHQAFDILHRRCEEELLPHELYPS